MADQEPLDDRIADSLAHLSGDEKLGRARAGLLVMCQQLTLAREDMRARQEGKPSVAVLCGHCNWIENRSSSKLRVTEDRRLEHQCRVTVGGSWFPTGARAEGGELHGQ
jgi:hypothetical protein